MITFMLDDWVVEDLTTIENPRKLNEWQLRAFYELLDALEELENQS